ncbi:hypothetical protein FRC12_018276 [Ceratobasidium sp. 428]|nr:hypothetical protein FRC12_018276 [Ceratobasidium sp. 428]
MSTTAFTLPSFSSSFDSMAPSHVSPQSSRSGARSSRSGSREPAQPYPPPPSFKSFKERPYPESNTRNDPERPPRKRPAPVDEEAERGADPDGDVGMRSDRDQDGDDESSGASSPSLPHVAVKEEQLSEVEQSPSPPPTPAGTSTSTSNRNPRPLPPSQQQRYAHPSGSGPQTHFAPTPPASARRVSPPHNITLPLLPHAGSSSNMTLPPLTFPPPSPSHAHHQHPAYQPPAHAQGYTHTEPMLARKRRRVTISGVAANSAGGAPPPRPLHRTVLERAGSGYGHAQTQLVPPAGAATGPTTPNPASGMVSPVVTPGFNMNSPGALDQVRDTIAIRMEQKALIEQRKNGGGLAGVPPPNSAPAAPPLRAPAPGQPPRTHGSPLGQSTHLPPNTLHAPTTSPSQGLAPPPLSSSTSAPGQLSSHASAGPPPALTAPLQQTQTLAHRRGKASKLTIHTPNTSISSSHGGSIGNASGLGLTGTDRPAGLAPNIEAAIRSAPPNVTRFDPSVGRPHPTHAAHRPPPQPTPLKERTVPIRRLHANSIAAPSTPSAPLAIVAPGQPLTLNAPAPPSSYVSTPNRPHFPPAQTPLHSQYPHPTPRTTTRGPGPASPPISRSAFMAFYDAYAEVHMLRAQMERMEREMDRRVEMAVRDMREEVRMLRDEVRRGQEVFYRDRQEYGRANEPGSSRPPHRVGMQRSGSTSVHQSPMQVDKMPLPPMDKDRQHLVRDKSMDRLHPHPHPRPVLRKSPSGRVQNSMSPPSRPPSVGPTAGPSAGEAGVKTRSSGKTRRSKSPGSKSGSG